MSQQLEPQEVRTSPTSDQRLKSYREYRDSGARWYGQIPQHWDMSSLGRLGVISGSGIDKKSREHDVPVRMVNYTDVYGNQSREIRGGDHLMETTAPDKKAKEHSLRKGDVLFTPSSETRDEIGVSAVVMEDLPGTVYSYHLTRFRPHIGLADSFKKYFANNKAVLGYFESVAEGTTRMTLTQGDFKRAPVLLPPRKEQEAIGTFLDWKTHKINQLIDTKERLIELMEERGTALITKAVTKGLDPDVPMKDSGVEWLGEIPEHWELPELRYISDPNRPIMYGIVLPGPSVEDGIPIIKGGDVSSGDLDAERLNRTTREIDAENASSRVQPGDVVYSIRGSFGDVVIVPPELDGANLTQDTARISPREDVSTSWLKFMLSSAPITAQANANALGAAVKGINIRELRRLRVPLPPREDQKAISDYLTQKTQRISDTVSAIRRAVNLLQECRYALITAAVTGKIDVRDHAA